MRRKYSKFLTITLIVIIVAVVGLLGYLGYDYYQKTRTDNNAADAVKTFTEDTTIEPGDQGVYTTSSETDPSYNGNNGQTTTTENGTGNSSATTTTDPTSNNGSTTSKKRVKPTYKGYNMIGTIEIPSINLSYPVLEKVTDKTLKLAVAAEWPQPESVLNEIGNVVIAGHNYRNGSFFSNIKKLKTGDKIYITDLDKKRVIYVIYNMVNKSDTDTTFYNKETNGKREITLKTCTDDGAQRLFIQAREQNT